jgi:hypothetical protein
MCKELSYLSGSYEMEEIFRSGRACPLKIRAGFYAVEG